MPVYPRRKAEKDVLYEAIVAGVTANPAEYPSGPGQMFALTTLNNAITAKNTAVSTSQQASADAQIATDAENDAYEACDEEATRLIRLAEAMHAANPQNLELIGWGAPGSPTSQPPGQPRTLEMCVQGPGSGLLDWKPPAPGGGGRMSFYRVERRVKDLSGQVTEEWGVWQQTTTASELSLSNQPRGVEIDYRVFAVNVNGDSVPSNTVTAVL